MQASDKLRVGIIGLGIMGTAYARLLLDAGYPVTGFDVSNEQCATLKEHGGQVANNTQSVAERSDVILIVLASVKALADCADKLSQVTHAGQIICEMGTFSLEQKIDVQTKVEKSGAIVLDCPVSGTGAQAAVGDLSVYISGNEEGAKVAKPVFETIARDIRYVGPFGTGIKLKLVANLLVTVHNLAAAEALLLAEQSGLDLDMVFDAIKQGAGTSRMFEIRGPMMVEENYQPATMKMDVYKKDLQLIMDHAQQVDCPTPLMAASLPYYSAGLAQNHGNDDTAALFAVLKSMTTPPDK